MLTTECEDTRHHNAPHSNPSTLQFKPQNFAVIPKLKIRNQVMRRVTGHRMPLFHQIDEQRAPLFVRRHLTPQCPTGHCGVSDFRFWALKNSPKKQRSPGLRCQDGRLFRGSTRDFARCSHLPDFEMPAVQLSLRVGFGYGEDAGAFEQALPPSSLSLFLFGEHGSAGFTVEGGERERHQVTNPSQYTPPYRRLYGM